MSMPQAAVVQSSGGVSAAEEVQFLRRLDTVQTVSNTDAVYAMTLYASHDDATLSGGDYPSQASALVARDLLPRGFDTPGDRAMDRGTLARFVAVALKLPRGLTASIVGLNGRYALRELEFRGLLPPSSENQSVSGPELIGIIARAADYRDAMLGPPPGVAVPPGENKDRPGDRPVTPDPTTSGPLPDITLASRSLDAMMLDLAAADPATAPAPADGYRFTALTGGVFVFPDGKDKPVAATVGLTIDAGTEVSTVGRATATLVGPHGEVVTVAPYTRLKRVATFLTPTNVARTDVQLQRGRVGAQIDHPASPADGIEGAGQQYGLEVQASRSTLAIKGTRVALYDQRPYDVEARSFTGTAVFSNEQRRSVAFGRKDGGLVTVTGQQPNPTGVALTAATEDPSIRNARTASEADLISSYFSRSSPIRFDRFTQLPTVFGGSGADAARFFAGPLNFVLSWTGDTNLNVSVRQSTGPVIYPYAALASQAGGSIPFDNRGARGGGFEVVSIPNPKTDEIYTVAPQNLGRRATGFTVQVFLNGKPVTLVNSQLQPVGTTGRGSIGPNNGTADIFRYTYDPTNTGGGDTGNGGDTGGGDTPPVPVIPRQKAPLPKTAKAVGPVAPSRGRR